ncbi:hypothetical protein GJ496_008933 [Pomphorhynchus laevis]|nr:hypothetical protein GJ496_008933 [Pomphorhynchus laevis]
MKSDKELTDLMENSDQSKLDSSDHIDDVDKSAVTQQTDLQINYHTTTCDPIYTGNTTAKSSEFCYSNQSLLNNRQNKINYYYPSPYNTITYYNIPLRPTDCTRYSIPNTNTSLNLTSNYNSSYNNDITGNYNSRNSLRKKKFMTQFQQSSNGTGGIFVPATMNLGKKYSQEEIFNLIATTGQTHLTACVLFEMKYASLKESISAELVENVYIPPNFHFGFNDISGQAVSRDQFDMIESYDSVINDNTTFHNFAGILKRSFPNFFVNVQPSNLSDYINPEPNMSTTFNQVDTNFYNTLLTQIGNMKSA